MQVLLNIILHVYLYDHSGLRIKVGSFQGLLSQGHAEFDSGQVGFIYVTHETIKKEYGKVDKKNLETAERVLRGEIATLDQYLRGDVYGFIIKEAKSCETCKHTEYETVDSCWGFYGIESVADGIKDFLPKDKYYLIDELEDCY